MSQSVALLLPEVTALCLCIGAARTDLATRRIPNPLTYAGMLLGVLEHAFLALVSGRSVLHAVGAASGGGLVCLVIFGTLAAVGSMGLGDVKLMTALGALFSLPFALWAAAYVLVAGGLVAIGYALGRGRLLESLRNIARGTITLGDRSSASSVARELPYGVAILVGTIWAVLTRHLPALQLQ